MTCELLPLVTGRACLIPGEMVNRVVWKQVVKRKLFINACFLRGSGSNYNTIIILLISPEKPTMTGK